MLQKLEDFWTYKDWEVLQESDKRPVFDPLRKVLDASSDVQTSTIKTASVRLGDGSGEPTSDNKKTSNKEKTGAIPGWYNIQQWTEQYERQMEESDKRPVFDPLRKVLDASSDVQTSTIKTASVRLGDGSGEPTSDNKKTSNKEKTGAIPGWCNIQQWTEQYERQMEMPRYTGYCVRNEEYRQHLDSRRESGNRRTDIDHYPADVYWADESYYRSTQEILAHSEATKTGGINQEIDEDIADLAAELLRGGSVLEVADNMAVRLDCPQWKNRIDVRRTCHPRQPAKTRKMKLPDNSDVLVNLIETGYLLQNRRPTSNTKTPCHTPALPVQRHNTFSTIPYSTNALLQRSLNKVNFLSSKQRSDPGQPLFRQKSDCEVNFSTYWNSKSQSFFFCASRYHPKTNVNLEQQSISTKVPSCSAVIDRKRKSSSDTVAQPSCKRPPTVSTKRPNSSGKKQSCVANVELFTVPVFIPSKTARFSTADHPSNK